jgi:cytochrome c556
MIKLTTLFFVLLLISIFILSCNDNGTGKQNTNDVAENHQGMMGNMKMKDDTRISLNLPPQKAQHQLMNMRNHVVAVQTIINYLANDEFDKASGIAHSQLGLTEEMQKMCTSFSNPDFVSLGLEFHKSADKLSETLKTGDKNKSLLALSTTLSYCINCHETFRQ